MLFNSIGFFVFLPVVFILYWFVANKSLKAQNLLLLAASYFFYACWDVRFLFLLMFSTGLDHFTGLKIAGATAQRSKKVWFWLSVVVNLGFLCVFKYYNFFAASFAAGVAHAGFKVDPLTLNVVLPVGISFYTFHGLSYVIDVYKGRIQAERNFVDYAVFVSFFPLLVAGPIERATHLLPQIKKQRLHEYSKLTDGLRQILWGLFKKIVIADQCAAYANPIFAAPHAYTGIDHAIGAVLFAFQIYCDFSGYSDIALGTARLFGIELLRNFAYPYFSRDIAEFWRRWHISLSTWFRDYLYIPLGGSRGSRWSVVRNVFIIFVVSGFWHGANFTFIVWGALNALFILPSILLNTNRDHLQIVAKGRVLPAIKELLAMILTFSLTTFAWIFFRCDTVGHAFSYVSELFTQPWLVKPLVRPGSFFTLLAIFVMIEWLGREHEYAIHKLLLPWPKPVRWAAYYILLFCIFYMAGPQQQFIYFQF